MTFIELIRELSNVLIGVSYPAMIFMIVWLFRDDVSQLRKDFSQRVRNDLKQVGVGGISFDSPQQNRSPETLPEPTQSSTSGSFKPIPPSPYRRAAEIEDQVNEQLKVYPAEERIPSLVKVLAEAQTERFFEFIWGQIYGSQLNALALLQQHDGSVAMADARTYFDEKVVPINPGYLSAYGFDRWLNYLLTTEVVQLKGDRLELTTTGSDFLNFTIRRKAGMGRPN
ncbi:hypothetical protein GOB48_19435 [Sinorhizobium meliloti]|nr:hypothetical protein [Sinorhizobium meliloti]